jgi:hypothetical protein
MTKDVTASPTLRCDFDQIDGIVGDEPPEAYPSYASFGRLAGKQRAFLVGVLDNSGVRHYEL